MFVSTCTSYHAAIAETPYVPRSKLRTCINSSASKDYCPDRTKFSNHEPVQHKITMADRCLLSAIGIGDLYIELPNGSGKTKAIFKNAVHAPEMAFTLISISRLNKASYSITFDKGMCTIKNSKSQTIATIPHSDGLYKIATPKQAKIKDTAIIAAKKMSISQAHRKLGHISYSAIKHGISQGFIAGIELEPDFKLGFCKACAKAKSAQQPFPKESETRAKRFGKCIHWDLWGPASIKSLNGNSYVAARINDAT